MGRLSRGWIAAILIVLLLLMGGLGALQVMGIVATRDMVREAISAPIGPAVADIELEKARQEAIGKRIENRSKALLQVNLATALGAGFGILISASGAVLAIFTYLSSREKEQIDRRDARDKDRQDRFGAALSETLTRLVGQEPRQRAVGAAGLLPFFTAERADFHLQALSALVAAARVDSEPPEVRQALRIALEQAARKVAPDTLRKLSWQGVKLPSVNLSGCNLAGLDLRDAELQDARLEGAILDNADLTNAQLQGAYLNGAQLIAANLTYADLAGANLAKANLSACRLEGVKVLNLDLEGAELYNIGDGWRTVPWDATRNWRKAGFDLDVRTELEARYGAEAPDLDVLMLMWEAPPFVAGGTWTACYHLVRRLRRRGAKVTVVVPWERSLIEDNPFGLDVPILALGIVPPDSDPATSPYGGSQPWSAYGGGPSWSVYGSSQSWSVYGGSQSGYGGAAPWSPYGSAGGYSGGPYGGGGPYGSTSAYGGPYHLYGAGAGLAGSVLFRLIGEFRRRLELEIHALKPAVIHAHDWVTFYAAQLASERTGAPWVAHFHSTERDRRPTAPDELTRQIEGMGAYQAHALVVPSEGTRRQLVADWGKRAERAQIAPNLLSDDTPSAAEMGRFETRRVVFVGRLSEQKGLDRFGEIAKRVWEAMPHYRFDVFGEGEDQSLVWRYGLNGRGPLPWIRRGEAFAGASVAVVPSRSEPFGMVVLEAMQHRTPVIYPASSGAAEVLKSGLKVDTSDIAGMAEIVIRLLSDLAEWESVVRAQAIEIDAYPRRPDDDRLIAVWRQAVSEHAAGAAATPGS